MLNWFARAHNFFPAALRCTIHREYKWLRLQVCFFALLHGMFSCTIQHQKKRSNPVTAFILCASRPPAHCCIVCVWPFLPVTRALVRTRTTTERYIFRSQQIHKKKPKTKTDKRAARSAANYIVHRALVRSPPEPSPTSASSPLFCVIRNSKCSVPT